ncbi:LacI family DNA-binding transcriptional regulator [Desertivirga brevis]|uniref:LacI family DNA-binding transcriptional regulator n=1 Tax=Desertivirga brevis TaxID=2810310 RepID=UPI001A977796|nr:LacI family DNA-binding transcriptional regulator [Pedobacter sp. SYSU D00873]
MKKDSEKVDLRTLAKQLNLSVSTVSRALNDSYEVSPVTKDRVCELAKKLNYQPNPYAKMLKEKSTKTIAVVIPEIENSFFAASIDGIHSVANQYGYHVLIYITQDSHDRETAIVKLLSGGRVDGVLISLSLDAKELDHLSCLSPDIPFVLFNRVGVDGPSSFSRVTADDFDGGYKAGRHLVEQGFRRILYLGISPNTSTDTARRQGLLHALINHREVNYEMMYCQQQSKEQNLVEIKKKLQSGKYDSVFVSVENLALPCYEACAELGLKIPEDLGILAFSNSPATAVFNPALTTVVLPAREIAILATQNLIFLLKGKPDSVKQNERLPSKLIVRTSTNKGKHEK